MFLAEAQFYRKELPEGVLIVCLVALLMTVFGPLIFASTAVGRSQFVPDEEFRDLAWRHLGVRLMLRMAAVVINIHDLRGPQKAPLESFSGRFIEKSAWARLGTGSECDWRLHESLLYLTFSGMWLLEFVAETEAWSVQRFRERGSWSKRCCFSDSLARVLSAAAVACALAPAAYFSFVAVLKRDLGVVFIAFSLWLLACDAALAEWSRRHIRQQIDVRVAAEERLDGQRSSTSPCAERPCTQMPTEET
jgi:hypothetical protein